MQYVKLGKSGLKVSRICLGTMTYGSPDWRSWVLDEQSSRPFIKHALELGINFFDTADMYSLGRSEEILGRALKDFARRDQVIIGSKVYWPMSGHPNDKGLSRKHIMNAIDASLKRLDTDYIDLYQIHRWDYETPIEETMEALNDLVHSGKVRYLGASSMFAYQFAKTFRVAEQHNWTKFISMQNHYNLIYREEEREMIPLCKEEGVAIIPWSPLARGFLAGNRRPNFEGETKRAKTDKYAHELYYSESDFKIADRVAKLARKRNIKPAQIALAWMLNKPHVTAPIIGASKLEQLDDAVKSLEIILDANEIKSVEELYTPHNILGHS
ncbi:MAG: aldo/keto reductase [Ignavibacteriales bacterium]|nr:aldo/keto reductase [Ignavibacteriales bacterium]